MLHILQDVVPAFTVDRGLLGSKGRNLYALLTAPETTSHHLGLRHCRFLLELGVTAGLLLQLQVFLCQALLQALDLGALLLRTLPLAFGGLFVLVDLRLKSLLPFLQLVNLGSPSLGYPPRLCGPGLLLRYQSGVFGFGLLLELGPLLGCDLLTATQLCSHQSSMMITHPTHIFTSLLEMSGNNVPLLVSSPDLNRSPFLETRP